MIIPIERKIPRVEQVVIPTLRESLAEKYPGIEVTSWFKQVTTRSFPFVNVKRLSGANNKINPDMLDHAVVEITAYTDVSLPFTMDLYLDVRYLLQRMWSDQVVIPDVGYIHSYFETLSPLPFDSPFEDTWRVQGLIQLGLRPPRSKE